MLRSFFSLAMLSASRQAAFRRAVVVHLVIVTAGALVVHVRGPDAAPILGQMLLIAGIVEGAILIGWRLTQLPKSQALEFLLVSPMNPRWVLLAEAAVGLTRLALVTLAGLPILALLAASGSKHDLNNTFITPIDLGPLLIMPFTWGAVTGLGLTTWAYEPLAVRRWVERGTVVMILIYLIVGVLAIDHLRIWLEWLPKFTLPIGADGITIDIGWLLLRSFEAFHIYNPFAMMDFWLKLPEHRVLGLDRMIGLEIASLVTIALLLVRSSARLKGHFHDRHYKPIRDPGSADRGTMGDKPLSWWAVRRVTEYSGRINLWLAAGFGLIYAAYTVAGPAWPPWLGQRVFLLVEHVGGIPAVAASLIVLAAVPASFQYGLWDSNAQDRCRRLELLLLTGLEGRDYWDAAAAAAWRRGRGYFGTALILWLAAWWAGKMDICQLSAAVAGGTVLWGLYFTLGFQAFSRGLQANGLGSLLTLGLPMVVVGLSYSNWSNLAEFLPPGNVYYAAARSDMILPMIGSLLMAAAALALARLGLARCDHDLRRWYDLHHGQRGIE